MHSFGKRDHAIKRNLNLPVVVRGWLYKQVSRASSSTPTHIQHEVAQLPEGSLHPADPRAPSPPPLRRPPVMLSINVNPKVALLNNCACLPLLPPGQLWNAAVEEEMVCFVRLLLVLLQR